MSFLTTVEVTDVAVFSDIKSDIDYHLGSKVGVNVCCVFAQKYCTYSGQCMIFSMFS